MNVPYRKEFDQKGQLSNPINGAYLNAHPNRRQRRMDVKTPRFRGNHRGISLSVVNNGKYSSKYQRVVQIVPIKDQSGKVTRYNNVNHYVERRAI